MFTCGCTLFFVRRFARAQAIAGFLAGRTAGRVLGPAVASRVGLAAIMGVGMFGVGVTQSWVGLAGLTGATVSQNTDLYLCNSGE